MKETISPPEAAEIAGVTVQAIYQWIRRKRLKAEKKVGRIEIDKAYFIKWLEENTTKFN